MISQINQIAKIQQILDQNQTTRFNSTLPISLKVLQKTGINRYLMLIGTQEMTTKSYQDLLEGKSYWAQMGKSSVGSILISKLTVQPKLMEMKEPPVKFTLQEFSRFFNETARQEGFAGFKTALLENLASSENRQEFLFNTNLFLSLQAGVITLPLWYEGRFSYLQMKKRKLEGTEENSLEFYAAFPNLGPIQGLLVKHQEELGLLLSLQYPGAKTLLEEELDALEGIDTIKLELLEKIVPFYEFRDSILDIRG